MGNVTVATKLRFLFQPSRYKVAYGGRGGSKSRAFATALVLAATAGYERILCCREIQKSIKQSVKKILEDEIERLGFSHLFTSTDTGIVCNWTGSEFLFEGLRDNVDSIKSMEGITKVWCEEAHTLSQNSINILEPTIRADDSELWFSYNPKNESDPVHKMFVVDAPPPGSKVVKINYYDNPWFPEVLRVKMEWDKAHDYEKYLHVWEGECVQFAEEQVMHGCWKVEETPEPPEGMTLRHGLDFGFSTDPTAGVRAWIAGRRLYIDYEAYGHGVEIDETPELLDSIPGMDKWPVVADSARPDSISYLNRHGYRVVGAKKGKGSIEDGIALIRGFEVVIHPRCVNIIEEFKRYSYKRDKATDKILPIIVDAWNHLIDALRYALEGIANTEVFPIAEKLIKEERLENVPLWWRQLAGIKFGVELPTAAVLIYHDQDNDIVHVRSTFRSVGITTPLMFAQGVRNWTGVDFAWTDEGLPQDKASGQQIATQYRDVGVNTLRERAAFRDGSKGVEAGITDMLDRMLSGRLKVDESLTDWWEEFRLYIRRDGLIVNQNNNLMDATRTAIMAVHEAQPIRSSITSADLMPPILPDF